jgi:hypothetical protein
LALAACAAFSVFIVPRSAFAAARPAAAPTSPPDPARLPALIQRLGNSAFANCRKLFVDDEVQKKPRCEEKTCFFDLMCATYALSLHYVLL